MITTKNLLMSRYSLTEKQAEMLSNNIWNLDKIPEGKPKPRGWGYIDLTALERLDSIYKK